MAVKFINRNFIPVLFSPLFCIPAVYAMPYPWFTGPLINNGGIVVDQHQIDFFPMGYRYVLPSIHGSSPENVIRLGGSGQVQYGFIRNIQFQVNPVYNYQRSQKNSGHKWGYTPFMLGVQFVRQTEHPHLPDLKLDIREYVPLGPFDNLSPDTPFIDGIGAGQNQFELVLNSQYLSMPLPDHEMYTYFSVGYGWFQKTHLSGFNVFGGGFGTDGVLSGSTRYTLDLAFEYRVIRHWVGVFEVFYEHASSPTFIGNPGVDSQGRPSSVFKPKVDSWSLAPAIEYDITSRLGLIFGPWFTVSASQDNKFFSLQIGVNYLTDTVAPPVPTKRFPL